MVSPVVQIFDFAMAAAATNSYLLILTVFWCMKFVRQDLRTFGAVAREWVNMFGLSWISVCSVFLFFFFFFFYRLGLTVSFSSYFSGSRFSMPFSIYLQNANDTHSDIITCLSFRFVFMKYTTFEFERLLTIMKIDNCHKKSERRLRFFLFSFYIYMTSLIVCVSFHSEDEWEKFIKFQQQHRDSSERKRNLKKKTNDKNQQLNLNM